MQHPTSMEVVVLNRLTKRFHKTFCNPQCSVTIVIEKFVLRKMKLNCRYEERWINYFAREHWNRGKIREKQKLFSFFVSSRADALLKISVTINFVSNCQERDEREPTRQQKGEGKVSETRFYKEKTQTTTNIIVEAPKTVKQYMCFWPLAFRHSRTFQLPTIKRDIQFGMLWRLNCHEHQIIIQSRRYEVLILFKFLIGRNEIIQISSLSEIQWRRWNIFMLRKLESSFFKFFKFGNLHEKWV